MDAWELSPKLRERAKKSSQQQQKIAPSSTEEQPALPREQQQQTTTCSNQQQQAVPSSKPKKKASRKHKPKTTTSDNKPASLEGILNDMNQMDLTREVAKMTKTQKWFFAGNLHVLSPPEDVDARAQEMVTAVQAHRDQKRFAELVDRFDAEMESDPQPHSLLNACKLMTLYSMQGLLELFFELDGIKKRGTAQAIDTYIKELNNKRAKETIGCQGNNVVLPTPRVDGPAACVMRLGIDRDALGLVPALAYCANVLGVSLTSRYDGYALGYGLVHWIVSATTEQPAHIHTLRWLAHRGADVNARTARDARGSNAGLTPLHLAVHNCNLEIVKALLELGADPNSRMQPNLHYFELNMPKWQSLIPASEAQRRFKGRPPLASAFSRRHWETVDPKKIMDLVELFASKNVDFSLQYSIDDHSGYFAQEYNTTVFDHAIYLADVHYDPVVIYLRDKLKLEPLLEDASDFFTD